MADLPGISLPAFVVLSIGRAVMPPVIMFGSPVQRSKDERVSFWHVPITIHPGRLWSAQTARFGPATIGGCEIFLDYFQAKRSDPDTYRLGWGDAVFGNTNQYAVLRRYHPQLVPIAWREEGGTPLAYWTDTRFLKAQRETHLPIINDRTKHRFRLRVKSGNLMRSSPHFYQLRVPKGRSNGFFTVEIEYEGEGSR